MTPLNFQSDSPISPLSLATLAILRLGQCKAKRDTRGNLYMYKWNKSARGKRHVTNGENSQALNISRDSNATLREAACYYFK